MILWNCCGNEIWGWRLILQIGPRYVTVFIQNVHLFPYMNKISNFSIEPTSLLFVSRKCSPTVQTSVVNAKCIKGTFIHLFWASDHIQMHWNGVHAVVQEITANQYTFSPSFYLLNHDPEDLFDTDTNSFVSGQKMYSATVVHSACSHRWHVEFSNIISLPPWKKITYDLNGKSDKFWKLLHS